MTVYTSNHMPETGRPVVAFFDDGKWGMAWRNNNGMWMEGQRERDVSFWYYADEALEKMGGMPCGFDDLEELVAKWAEDRNLITGSTPKDQYCKLVEEVGEIGGDLARRRDVRDSIGDSLVVLTIIARQFCLTLRQCYEVAYKEIKDRKGKMVDGVFVKEEDLRRRIEVEPTVQEADRQFCAYCNTSNSMDAEYCENCRLNLRDMRVR